MLFSDDGSDEPEGDITWRDDSFIRCDECKHEGTVKGFTIEEGVLPCDHITDAFADDHWIVGADGWRHCVQCGLMEEVTIDTFAEEGKGKVQKSFTVIGVFPDDLDREGPQGASFMENVKAVDVEQAIRLVEAMDAPIRAEAGMIISVIEGWHSEAGETDEYNG